MADNKNKPGNNEEIKMGKGGLVMMAIGFFAIMMSAATTGINHPLVGIIITGLFFVIVGFIWWRRSKVRYEADLRVAKEKKKNDN